MAELTPMMQQYRTVKERNPDCVNGGMFAICDSGYVPLYIKWLYGKRYPQYCGSQIFKDLVSSQKYRMFFMGTNQRTLDGLRENLKAMNPKVENMSFYELPFKAVDEFDYPAIAKMVNEDGADIIWKMTNIDKLMNDGTFSNLSKRELLQVSRQRAKLEKNLGSIADLSRLPSALFVIDVMKEHIAVKEANRLGIPVFGIVDTNSDPKNVDYVIPANDDAKDSVDAILTAVCGAIAEALEERKAEKADDKAAAEQKDQPKKKAARKDEAE